ncbi:glutamate--cysteine ligase family protein [endosymbiont of unidentified scaly snail isolate Monju]|uniref:hypothetical protein n=1 Tax=endosymbiont of unidentified scaly snail isolate Monju TaxID=1248727 RepID=UPI0003892534|nr:hypothetical protein [endosymbiont of unidentified scaly snail isolate Monju]BAN68120.1 hypothetical protein EBS_0132 [endosymbiont of unidentified scaly snail isolate Monju]
MGQEIHSIDFTPEAFEEYRRRLRTETELLVAWEHQGRLRSAPFRLGFELEGWLVDEAGEPAARNAEFLAELADPQVVPELARFNFEINDDPLPFTPGMFDCMHASLQARWARCEEAVRAFNAAKVVSAATVAVGANSPFFLQRRLWEETRIPLFEQAVAVGGSDYSRRVTFGIRYAHESLLEPFIANLERYPVLLPDLMDEPPEHLAHLRLHNGTIWRWNRPLVGFDEQGRPHYRIEHRVVAAGTSVADLVADTAFFAGLVHALITEIPPPETRLSFALARENFYRAARHGLAARVRWLEDGEGPLDRLVVERLLPLARDGLHAVGLDDEEIARWLGIVEARVRSGITGSAWQRHWIDAHGPDWPGLVMAYAERQATGRPVHEWPP